MKKISIAWAEDDETFSAAVCKLLKAEGDDWLNLIIVLKNGLEMLKFLEDNRPDIVLMDIRMPIMNGIEASRIIFDKYPLQKIIAFSQFDIEENIVEMNKVGVKSFISKNRAENLLSIIELVCKGGVYFPDEVAEIIRQHLCKGKSISNQSITSLNPFEKQLLKAICEGNSSTTIAKQFFRSPELSKSIVRSFIKNLEQKTRRNSLLRQFNITSIIYRKITG